MDFLYNQLTWSRVLIEGDRPPWTQNILLAIMVDELR